MPDIKQKDMMKIEQRGIFVHGKEVLGKTTYEVFNPHTEEKLADVAWATGEEMTAALDSASKGFQAMKALPSHERADILFHSANLFEKRLDKVAQTICAEASKPITAAYNEVKRTIETLRFSAEEAKRLEGETLSLDAAKGGEGRYAFTIYEPIGIVGAITPFNFPVNLVMHKVAPALASGNSIVLKPAEQTPLSALMIAEILSEAGVPDGAVNVVPGDGPQLGEVLLKDERVAKISFTGSPEVGKLIKSKSELKKVTLELGSNSAMYVDKSSEYDLASIVKQAVAGAFANSGQVCLSTQRIYVHESIYGKFEELLVKETKKITFGPPDNDETIVSSLINKKARQRILSWLEEAKEQGAKVIVGGKAKANGIEPTVLKDTKPDMKVSREELFGPVVLIHPVANGEEALELINNSRYGLNAGIFTNNLKQGLRMAKNIEVGQVLINDVPTLRFDHMPYGGLKDSGYGREGVKYAIEKMTEMKMISIKFE